MTLSVHTALSSFNLLVTASQSSPWAVQHGGPMSAGKDPNTQEIGRYTKEDGTA